MDNVIVVKEWSEEDEDKLPIVEGSSPSDLNATAGLFSVEKMPRKSFFVAKVSGREFWVEKMNRKDVEHKTTRYRRQLFDIFDRDENLVTRMNQDKFGLSSLCKIDTKDSNESGIVFTFDVNEYVEDVGSKYGIQDEPLKFPRKVVIKVSRYYVSPVSGKGSFTHSDNPLHRLDPTNVEMQIMAKLRELVLSKKCPNILLLYKHFVVDDFQKLEYPPCSQKQNFEPMRKQLLVYPPRIRKQAMVLLMEFASYGSLRQWRKAAKERTELQWKVIIFHLTFTLAVIQSTFKIRHNDLHQGNVFLDRCKKNMNCFENYIFEGESFFVPCVGYSVRLADFDWSTCEELENGKTKTKDSQRMGFDKYCDRFDLHRFLNHVYCSTTGNIPTQVKDMIASIIPAGYLGEKSQFVHLFCLKSDAPTSDLPSPKQFLSHPWFQEFKHPSPPNQNKIVEVYQYP